VILSKLAAATLVIGVAAGPTLESSPKRLSLQQKDAAVRAYMRLATECIVRGVSLDSRFRKDDPADHLGDLIVDAVPKCVGPVRAMINAHDEHFGEGSGEDFFTGAYLDFLPTAVLNQIKDGGR
jgi:hypothetical protein